MAEKKPPELKSFIPEDVVEHARAARTEMRKSFESLMPDNFLAHRRAAHKEILMAFRGLIDHALEKIEARQ